MADDVEIKDVGMESKRDFRRKACSMEDEDLPTPGTVTCDLAANFLARQPGTVREGDAKKWGRRVEEGGHLVMSDADNKQRFFDAYLDEGHFREKDVGRFVRRIRQNEGDYTGRHKITLSKDEVNNAIRASATSDDE